MDTGDTGEIANQVVCNIYPDVFFSGICALTEIFVKNKISIIYLLLPAANAAW